MFGLCLPASPASGCTVAAGGDTLASHGPAFLALAETLYAEMVSRHCLGECSLPLTLRYADPEGSEVPALGRARYLLRASHALDESGHALSGVFDSSIVTCEAEIGAALARVALSYFRAPLEALLETVSPDIHLFPGNFLLQPLVSVRQAGVLKANSSAILTLSLIHI